MMLRVPLERSLNNLIILWEFNECVPLNIFISGTDNQIKFLKHSFPYEVERKILKPCIEKTSYFMSTLQSYVLSFFFRIGL